MMQDWPERQYRVAALALAALLLAATVLLTPGCAGRISQEYISTSIGADGETSTETTRVIQKAPPFGKTDGVVEVQARYEADGSSSVTSNQSGTVDATGQQAPIQAGSQFASDVLVKALGSGLLLPVAATPPPPVADTAGPSLLDSVRETVRAEVARAVADAIRGSLGRGIANDE